jgi:hypothetical protein
MSNFNNKFDWRDYFDLSLELADVNNVEEVSNITYDYLEIVQMFYDGNCSLLNQRMKYRSIVCYNTMFGL